MGRFGTLGIGTTAPAYGLDVTGYARATLGLIAGNSSTNNLLDPTGMHSLSWGNTLTLYTTNGSGVANLNQLVLNATTGNVGIGTTSPLTALDIRGNSGTTAVASISGQTSFAALVTNNNGVGDLFTASASSWTRFRITNAGTLLPGLNNAQDIGSSSLQWNNIYGQNIYSNGTLLTNGGLWQRNQGALAPLNITDDLLIGGISTATADFAFTGMSTGQTQASISGNLIVMANNGYGGRVGICISYPLCENGHVYQTRLK